METINMQYFTKESAFTYLTLTNISFFHHWISKENYHKRLYFLKLFCDPHDSETISNIEIYISFFENWFEYDERTKFQYSEYSEMDIKLTDENDDEIDNLADIESQDDDLDPLLYFITARKGKISKWIFHKGDRDSFPSIPHGHARIDNNIKLDPYTGFMCKNKKKYIRETRQYIVDLWNDNKFRDFAKGAIIFYMNEYPKFSWRVSNPLRLPKRRR